MIRGNTHGFDLKNVLLNLTAGCEMNPGKLTKWGTSVPEGYTVEEYEIMIESANERASKIAEITKAKQVEKEEQERVLEAEMRTNIDNLFEITINKTIEFCNVLLRKRRNLRYFDEYGLNDVKWTNEKAVFIERVLSIAFYRALPRFDYTLIIENISSVIDIVLDGEESGLNEEITTLPVNGVEYELFCKIRLEELGWCVTLTPLTSDQGADLIAEKGAIRIAIQCKRYSSPVGNAAVQEVVAAKSFYDADFAVVVSNNDFTSGARQLAAATKVYLLHHDDLTELENFGRA